MNHLRQDYHLRRDLEEDRALDDYDEELQFARGDDRKPMFVDNQYDEMD